MLSLIHSRLMLGLLPLLAQAGQVITITPDSTFGGFMPFLTTVFWAAMGAMFMIAIVAGVAAAVMAYRNQEVPVMLLATIGVCIAIPAICFILGHILGLDQALTYFKGTSS